MINICCRKCSTPLLDGARFCSTCGTFNPSDDDQPDSPTSQFSSVTDAMTLKSCRGDSSVIIQKESEDKIFLFPTLPLQENEEQGEILLLPPVQTIESVPTRVEHKQPQDVRANHQQPQSLRSEHEQPQSEHAEHEQPESKRAAHRQIQNQHSVHFQPLQVQPSHVQPGTLVKKRQNVTFSKQFSWAVRIAAVITMIITTILLLSYFSRSSAAPQQQTSTPAGVETPMYSPTSQSTPKAGGTPQPVPGVKATPAPNTPSQPGPTPPCLNIDTSALTFRATTGGNNPGSQTLTLTNGNGCGAGTWSATSDSAWLTLDHAGGNIDANGSIHLRVSTALTNLKAGTYTGHIQANPGAKSVTVTLNVLPVAQPCITTKTNALNFTATVGGTPASQTVSIANGPNCGAGTWSVASDAPWLHAQGGGSIAAGGSASAAVTVSTNGLAAGNYTGHLTFSADGSKPTTVTVGLKIQSSLCPQVDTKGLSFSGDVGANKSNPGAQVVTVSNSCGRATVAAGASAPWLTVTGRGAIGDDGKIAISVRAICLNADNVAILKPGTYTSAITITITASGGAQASVKIPVSFTVAQSGAGTVPIH